MKKHLSHLVLVNFSFSFLIEESTSKAFFDDYIHNKIVIFGKKKSRYSLIQKSLDNFLDFLKTLSNIPFL